MQAERREELEEINEKLWQFNVKSVGHASNQGCMKHTNMTRTSSSGIKMKWVLTIVPLKPFWVAQWFGLRTPCWRSQVRNPLPAKARGLPFGSSSAHRACLGGSPLL